KPLYLNTSPLCVPPTTIVVYIVPNKTIQPVYVQIHVSGKLSNVTNSILFTFGRDKAEIDVSVRQMAAFILLNLTAQYLRNNHWVETVLPTEFRLRIKFILVTVRIDQNFNDQRSRQMPAFMVISLSIQNLIET